MLSRLSRKFLPSIRCFSGSDPHMLHLKQQHDNYPQYAHLHWHTFDPLEVGKYAKYRSKELYGDHVSEDPAPIEWNPEAEHLTTLSSYARDEVYDLIRRHGQDFETYLEWTNDQRVGHEGKVLADSTNEIYYRHIKPEQIKEVLKFAKKTVGDYKAAGLTVTKEEMQEKVTDYFLTTVTKHQYQEIEHELDPYLKKFGIGFLTGR